MICAILCGIMLWKRWLTGKRCWSLMRPASSNRVRHPVVWRANIPDRRARLVPAKAGITNCQIGVFAAYVSHHGHAFIDRALYLPKTWTDDLERMAKAHIPEGTCFATKPAIARTMIERAIAANVPFA